MGDTIQEDLREAFAEAEKEPGSTPAAAPAEPQQPPRDEQGRFAPRQEPSEVAAAAALQPDAPRPQTPPAAPAEATPGTPAAAPAATPPAQEGQWHQDKAPLSWNPTAREKWMTIPEDLRKEIIRREEASVEGVRQLKEQYAPVEHVLRGIDPYVREAVQNGIDPGNYLGAVLQSERLLRRADVPTKFQEILRIADQYGVPLRQVIDASVGQQILTQQHPQQQQQIPPQVAQELQEMRQWRAQSEAQAVKSEIDQFAVGKEFFNDVREHMAGLVEHGLANGLQDAYDQACWANPQVRAVLTQRQAGGQQQADLQQRQQAAAAASLTPNGKIDVPLAPEGKDGEDLEATVRQAMYQQATQRV